MDDAPAATPPDDTYARFAAIRLVVAPVWYLWLGMCLRGQPRRSADGRAAGRPP